MKKYNKLIGIMLIAAMTLVIAPVKVFASDSLSTMTPIHSFDFDNDSGTIINDSVTGSTVKGTATGTTLVTGYDGNGYARHFDGNSCITFNDKVIPAGKKTISFKIRKSTLPTNNNCEYFLGNLHSTRTDYGMYGMILPGGNLGIAFSNAAESTHYNVKSTISVCDGKWHNILFTWNGSKNDKGVCLYVDDMKVPTTMGSALFSESDASAATYNFKFGSLGSEYQCTKFIGDLDDFKVYNDVYVPETPKSDYAGSNAILEIVMTNGTIKEYSLTNDELESFLTWYDNRSDGTGKPYYRIPKKSNVKPFLSRKEYLSFDKIYSFEVKDYNE
ncbi:MAG: laminin G domain-containing protein [Velocimicrobium sp.]